jgi:large subunit ribosomal protein L6
MSHSLMISLGQLTLNIPPFVNINHDQTARKATVSVQDAEIPHQRAMWGMYSAQLCYKDYSNTMDC